MHILANGAGRNLRSTIYKPFKQVRIMSKAFSIQRIQRAIGSRPIVFGGELVATFFGFFFLSEHKEISLSDTTSEQIQSVCTGYDKMDDETINLLLEKLNA